MAVVRAKFWIKDKLKAVGEFLAKIPSLVKGWVDETLKNAGSVGEQVANVFSGISSFFTGVWGTISDVWTGITTGDWTGFKDRIANAFNNVKTFFANIGKIIRAFFTGRYKGLDNDTAAAVARARVWVRNKLKVVGDFFKILPETFKGWGEELQKNFGPLGGFFSTIFNAIGSVINFIIKHPVISLILLGLFAIIRFIGSATGLFFRASEALWAFQGGNLSLSKAIRHVAVSFGIVAASIFLLGTVMNETQLKQGMDAFYNILRTIGGFLLFAAILSAVNLTPGPLKGISKKLTSVTSMIKDIGIGIGLLVLSIFVLSKMVSTSEGFGNFLKGLGALFLIILEILGLFAGLAVINKKIGKIETVLHGLWQVAVVIGAMTLALGVLVAMNSITKPETVWVSISQLAVMLAMIAGLFLAIGYANRLADLPGDSGPLLKGLGALAGLIAVMGIVVSAFAVLNSLGFGVWEAILQLGTTFVLVAALFWIIGKIGNVKVNWGTLIAAFVGLGAIIWVLGEALSKMGDIDWPVVAAFTLGLSVALLALAGVMKILSTIESEGSAKAFVALVAACTGIALGLGILSVAAHSVGNTFTVEIMRIGEAISSFSNAMSSVQGDPSLDFSVFVATMVNAFTKMGEANYGYVNQFIGALSDIGAAMVLYSGTTTGLQTLDGSSLLSLSDDLSSAISYFTLVEPGDIENLTKTLTDLGGALGLFFGNVSNISIPESGEIDVSAVQSVFSALGQINIDESAMANIARYAEDGDGSVLSDFALGIQNLSSAITNYASSIGGLNDAPIDEANSVLTTISGISVDLSGVDALTVGLQGKESALGQFSRDVVKLGEALASYGTNIGGLQTAPIEQANNVLTAISGLQLDKENGVVQFFTGSSADSMTLFANNIGLLGDGLAKYGTNIGGLQTAPIEQANNVLTAISGLQLDKENGVVQFFTGSSADSMTLFANNIGLLGDGLAKFGSSISGETFDVSKVTAAISPLKELGAIQKEMGDIGGIVSFFAGDQSIGALGAGLADFGENLAAFSGWVNDLDFGDNSKLTQALGAIETIGTIQAMLSGMDITQFSGFERVGDSLERFFGSLARIGSGTLSYAKDLSFDDALEAVYYTDLDFDPIPIIEKITNFATQITTAASQAQTDVQTAVQTMLSYDPAELSVAMSEGMAEGADDSGARQAALTLLSGAESYISQFNTVGMNYALGLAQGMMDNAAACGAAGTAIGQAAIDAARAVGAVASPSQVLFAIGEYFGLGFVKGLESYAPIIDNACTSIFGGALSGVQNLFSGDKSGSLVDMIFGGFKKSDVKNTQNALGGLWNTVKGFISSEESDKSGGFLSMLLGTFNNKDIKDDQGVFSGLWESIKSLDWSNPTNAITQLGEKFNFTGQMANLFGIDLNNSEGIINSFATQMGFSEEQVNGLTESLFGLGTASTTVTASLPAITRELKKGDWDDDQVKAMQERLMALGYDLSKFGADGKFGDETLAALTQFETDFGLEADGILSTIDAKQLELEAKKAGGGSTVSFTGGETSSEDTAAASQAATDMVAAFKSHGNEFYGAGGYFTLGLAGGASKYLNTAVNAAAAIAAAMLAKVREVFRSASPSKETAMYGMWFDQGLAQGVNDHTKEAITSSEDVANAMLKTTKGTLSNLSAIIANDMDDMPTISPVVDLTNARAAAASIGGMFGTQTFGVESANLASKAHESYSANKVANQKARDSLASVSGRSNTNNTSSNVNLTGNNFYVRSDRDVDNLAYEIASISKQQLRGVGQRI